MTQSGHEEAVGVRTWTGRTLRRGKRAQRVIVVPFRAGLPVWPVAAEQLRRFDIINDNESRLRSERVEIVDTKGPGCAHVGEMPGEA
jgi:hypothetical protein